MALGKDGVPFGLARCAVNAAATPGLFSAAYPE